MTTLQELDWPGLVSLLVSDLTFRSRNVPAEMIPPVEAYRDVFERLRPDIAWGSESDEQAWQEFARRVRVLAERVFSGPGFRFEDIDEIVQRLLVKFQSLRSMARLASVGSIRGYLAVVVRRIGLDVFRERTAERDALLRFGWEVLAVSFEVPPFSDSNRRVTRLRTELRLLSDDDRKLLRARFWKEDSIAEIAQHMKVSYSAVASRLFRILKRLRDRLNEDENS